MPRVILDEQTDYKFKYTTTIQTRDLNYAGHLGNDTLVGIIQDARKNVFKDLGFQELDLGDGRVGIIIADMVVNFKGEGFMFDKVVVESQIGEISPKSFRLFHRVTKAEDKTLMALIETGLLAFDYKTRQVVEFPKVFKKVIGE